MYESVKTYSGCEKHFTNTLRRSRTRSIHVLTEGNSRVLLVMHDELILVGSHEWV